MTLMFTSSPGCYNPLQKPLEYKRYSKVAALRALLTKVLQAVKENTDDYDEKFLKATNLKLFHVHLLIFFAPQRKDQVDSDFVLLFLFLNLVIRNNLLKISKAQGNDTDPEQFTKNVIFVFIETEFDTSSSTEDFQKMNRQHSTDF